MSEQPFFTPPFFTVVIPVYNRAGVLGAAVASVLAQTEQDFEIVVVDDGSKDDPARALPADPRIRFVRQPNKGGGAARNAGIDLARGRFVAFLDSDDVYLPNHLGAMRRLLDGTTDTVGYARIVVDRGEGRTFLKPPRAIRAGEHMATYLLCDRGFVPTITVAVERETAKRVRYHEDLRTAEDTDFAIRLFLAGQSFVMAEQPGAVWKDVPDPGRTSAGRKGGRMIQWLEELRPRIPARAYHGCRGWAIAKYVILNDRGAALKLYLRAALGGCYRPGLAGIVALQIFLSDRVYRAVADCAIRWLRAGLRPKRRLPAVN
ncbi:MAG TPA: glycosyltransferase family 2 protein [Rhizomicrobium sp.]|nr:glycosyltransferase family 2 protein [Rhizomicrobium sp.]